jgi:hypothetical protein
MRSASQNEQCAVNALSFSQDDGTSFNGVEPRVSRQIPVGLRFRIDRMVLADGALSIPNEMEHKWALYFHRGQIIFIRSWLREVVALAATRIAGDFLEVTTLRGAFVSEEEAAEFTVRVLMPVRALLLGASILGFMYRVSGKELWQVLLYPTGIPLLIDYINFLSSLRNILMRFI